MCVTPSGHAKNDTDLKFGMDTPLDHISKRVFFLFFQKSDSEGRWPRTTAASRGYTAYVLDCLVFLPERFCLTEHTLDGTVGVWALTLDLAGFG